MTGLDNILLLTLITTFSLFEKRFRVSHIQHY